MHTFFKRKLLIISLTFILLFLAEMTVYLIIFGIPFSQSIFMELSFFLIILAPAFLFRSNKGTIAYTSILLSLILFLFAINITLDYTSRDVFTFEYLAQAGEATKVFDWAYLNWFALLVFFGFSGLYVGGLFLIYKKIIKGDDTERVKYLPKGVLISLCLIVIATITQIVSLRNVEKQYEKSELNGLSGYEIVQYYSKYWKKTSMKMYGILYYSLATTNGDAPTISEYDFPTDINPNTTTPSSNSTDELKCLPVTDEYYGLLKNYNVIEIMIESGSKYLFDENLTPNLYKLASEGIYFTNNYSKNKTNMSEFIGINGALVSSIQNYDGKLPYSIPNMLSNYGYTTNYFHNNTGEFYNRVSEMPILGFDNINFTQEINPDRAWQYYDGNYPLDSETMGDILTKIAPVDSEAPYYSFWTSLSMHGPYTGKGNKKKFEDLGYYDKLKAAEYYGTWENPCKDDPQVVQDQIEFVMCATMDFDYAIGMLINYLDITNQLDNTLLVLYGDHETYFSVGTGKPLKEYVYNCNNETYPAQYETMMFMYNPTLTQKYKTVKGINSEDIAYYTDFTSPYILVPTILELLGVEYNPDIYTGVSIFQTTTELDNVFYSNELGCAFTDKIYTINPLLGELDYQIDGLSDEYIALFKRKSFIVVEKKNAIEKMYNSKLFRES